MAARARKNEAELRALAPYRVLRAPQKLEARDERKNYDARQQTDIAPHGRRRSDDRRSYPPVKGAKRLNKDRKNQAQRLLSGKGPARTVKG